MTKGVAGKEPDPRIVYADIIDQPHWQSPTRPHMSLYDRAAQFSAYKALTGYEDMVNEEARLTDDRLELGDSELELLNQKLAVIAAATATGNRPEITFTIFVPDRLKQGGRYTDMTDTVKTIDETAQKVVLTSRTEHSLGHKTIDFDQIIAIHGSLVDYLDDLL